MHQLGENESRIRKTVKGEIVLELMGVKKRSDDKYKKEICKVLDNKAEIKVLTHTKLLEIRDLDDVTTKDDIGQAIWSHLKQHEFDENFIKSTRKVYAGTQTPT